MEVEAFENCAEDMLYATLIAFSNIRGSGRASNIPHFLQFKFFHIAHNVMLDEIEQLFEPLSDADDAALYFCSDGDVIFKWVGGNHTIREGVIDAFLNKYGSFIEKFMPLETFFEEYDNIDGISRLKVECAKKLKKQTKKSLELSKYFTNEQLIHSLKNTVKLTQMQRAFRVKPHILIVDDQVFSQKILETILKDYTCHIADSSGEALLVYMEKCPDIVFLDIELPDINGHHFAKLANRIDENAYIVMVSGNKQQEEIKTALSNNVKGFIAKPYEKQTILKIVDQYANIKSKNLRHKQL